MADRSAARAAPADTAVCAPAAVVRAKGREALEVAPLDGTRCGPCRRANTVRSGAPGPLPSRGARRCPARYAARMGDRPLAATAAAQIARAHPAADPGTQRHLTGFPVPTGYVSRTPSTASSRTKGCHAPSRRADAGLIRGQPARDRPPARLARRAGGLKLRSEEHT